MAAGITMTHNPFGADYWASCLRENLTSSSFGEGLETDRKYGQALRQSHIPSGRHKGNTDFMIAPVGVVREPPLQF